MKKYVGWALVVVLLVGGLGWWWWWECRSERLQLQLQVESSPGDGVPPPGPIIDIDPKQAAGAAVTVDSQLPACVPLSSGELNKWWIGSIMKFEAVLDTGQLVRLKKVTIPWTLEDVGGDPELIAQFLRARRHKVTDRP